MKLPLLENNLHFANAITREFVSGLDVSVFLSIASAKGSFASNVFDMILVD